MIKRLAVIALCLAALTSLSACGGKTSGQNQPGTTAEGKVKVSVTFNAMREFTEAVGGDRVQISTIIPDGTEPHDFEPKAQDLATLGSAAVFVYNGLGMETWADNAVQAAGNKKLIAVEASKGIDPITNTDSGAQEEHEQYDPHAWLSLKCAETEAKNIRDALIKADPSGTDVYTKNCDNFIAQLEGLFNQYNIKFQSAGKKSFVTGHAAFSYLCRDFGITQNSVEDVFAEGEPTAKQLSQLVEYCRENNVTTIFSEEMVSPEVSETLAGEVGAKVKTIYTIESAEDNKTYLERMEADLAEIDDSLAG